MVRPRLRPSVRPSEVDPQLECGRSLFLLPLRSFGPAHLSAMADSRQLSPTSTLHDDRDQRQHASSSALEKVDLEKVDLAEKGSAVPYDGAGTAESPYIVKFFDGEQANPQNWTKTKKWQVLFFPCLNMLFLFPHVE